MTFSSPVLALCVDLWSDPVERPQPRESIKPRLNAAENAERGQRKRFRCLHAAGNKQTYDLSFARGKIQKTSRNSGPHALAPWRIKTTRYDTERLSRSILEHIVCWWISIRNMLQGRGCFVGRKGAVVASSRPKQAVA